jgi:hypothetical protein
MGATDNAVEAIRGGNLKAPRFVADRKHGSMTVSVWTSARVFLEDLPLKHITSVK